MGPLPRGLLLACALPAALLTAGPARARAPASLDVEVEITASDVEFESRGPCTSLAHVVGGAGQLFVWAESEGLDPYLHVESADGKVRISDDDSGGGTTAWVRAVVEAGAELEIVIAGPDPSKLADPRLGTARPRPLGKVRVHLREMPSTEASRAARVELEQALADAGAAVERGELLAARARVEPAIARALAAEGVELDAGCHGPLWRGADAMFDWGNRRLGVEVCQALVRFQADRYPPDCRARLQPLASLCGVLAELGRPAEGLPWCRACIEVADRGFGPESAEGAAARHNLGTTLLAAGDVEGALDLIRASVRISEQVIGERDPRTAQTWVTLGSVYYQLGDLEESRRYEELAVKALSESLPPTDPLLLAAVSNLASTLDALGDDRAARAMHQRVLEVQVTQYEPTHPEVLRSRYNVAVCRLRLGEVEPACDEFAALRAKWREAGVETTSDAEYCDSALADALNRLGRHGEALEVARSRRALREREGRRDANGDWRVASEFAHSLVGLGQFEAALVEAERSLASAQLGLADGSPDVAEIRQLAARLNARLGRRERALELTRRGIVEARGYLARCAMTLSIGEAEAAQAHWSRLVSDGLALLEATAIAGNRPESRAEADAQAFELAESARAIGLALPACARAASSPRIEALRRKLRADAREVVRVGSSGGAPSEVERAIAAKESSERELRAALREATGGRLDGLQPTAEEARRGLAADEALIAFWRFDRRDLDAPLSATREPRLLAFVLRREAPVRRVDLGPLEPVAAAVAAWREAIARGGAEERTAGESLRRLTIDPLAAAIGDAKRLCVALDDVLHLVPLDALPWEDRRLGDRWRIVVAPMGVRGSAGTTASDSDGGALLVVGGVDYGDAAAVSAVSAVSAAGARSAIARFPGLPGTREEIEAIAGLIEGGPRGAGSSGASAGASPRAVTRLAGRDVTRTAFAAAAAGAHSIHVATHGFFLERGSRSSAAPEALGAPAAPVSAGHSLAERSPLALCGLALAGANAAGEATGSESAITAEELATLDLSACGLVVLSACDTHVGERSAGQGVASFQKALHAAGARTVVTSLWKVSDSTTRELMLSFYRHLWFDGLAPEEALWRAKSERIALRAPLRDWAGWVLSRR